MGAETTFAFVCARGRFWRARILDWLVFCSFFSLCLILGLGSVASAEAEEAKEKRSRLPILGMVSALCVSIFDFTPYVFVPAFGCCLCWCA